MSVWVERAVSWASRIIRTARMLVAIGTASAIVGSTIWAAGLFAQLLPHPLDASLLVFPAIAMFVGAQAGAAIWGR